MLYKILIEVVIVWYIPSIKFHFIHVGDETCPAIFAALLGTHPIFAALFNVGTYIGMTTAYHFPWTPLTLNILNRTENVVKQRIIYTNKFWKYTSKWKKYMQRITKIQNILQIQISFKITIYNLNTNFFHSFILSLSLSFI